MKLAARYDQTTFPMAAPAEGGVCVGVCPGGSREDGLSPHALGVLALLVEAARTDGDGVHVPPRTHAQRWKLNELLLTLLQGCDIPLSQLHTCVLDCCIFLADRLIQRLGVVVLGGSQAMETFFLSFEELLSATSPTIGRHGVLGMFVRRMLLAYNRLSFAQTRRLCHQLRKYWQGYIGVTQADSAVAGGTMEVTAGSGEARTGSWLEMEASDNEDIGEGPSRGDEPMSGDDDLEMDALSTRRAAFFLIQQADLVQRADGAALAPRDLHARLSSLLRANPDCDEAHLVSCLNAVRVRDTLSSLHSLHHYYDRATLSTSGGGVEPRGSALNPRYAALNMAALHSFFGHLDEARLALQESISKAEGQNDQVCLQHCLSLLAHLERARGVRCVSQLELSVRKASQVGLSLTSWLGVQALVCARASLGVRPSVLLRSLSEAERVGGRAQHAMSALAQRKLNNSALKTALWNLYGKSVMACQQAQRMVCYKPVVDFPSTHGPGETNTEALCVALCHLARLHAHQGLYQASMEVIDYAREKFPHDTHISRLWKLVELAVSVQREVSAGRPHVAEALIPHITALNPAEGMYSQVNVLRAQGRLLECAQLLQTLMRLCEENRPGYTPELHTKSLLALGEVHVACGSPERAVPLLLRALQEARTQHAHGLLSSAAVSLAHAQLLLSQAEQANALVRGVVCGILAHGAMCERARALRTLAQTQAALSRTAHDSNINASPEWMEKCVENLEQAKMYHQIAGETTRVRDVLYLQARAHHALSTHYVGALGIDVQHAQRAHAHHVLRNKFSRAFRDMQAETITSPGCVPLVALP